MNKERELLESCLDEFQYQSFPCTELVTRIQELLAQPEQQVKSNRVFYQEGYAQAKLDLKREPIDTRRITLEMFSDGVDINYKDGYVAGIRFAEKAHGIGGGE